MTKCIFLLIVAALVGAHDLIESKSIQKIKVMASHAIPYVIRGENSLRGLDVDIVENFAKKHELEIEYVMANQSLQEIFNTQDMIESFLQTIQDL